MKRTVAGVGAGVLALTGVAGAFALPANATSTFSFSRIAGQDRYETAAKIATSTFTTADNVLVASGENYPDALSGNYLAGFKAGPILLTPQAQLSSFTSSALSTLQAKNVTILGGTSAVSTNVENQLKAAGYTVTRLGGTDRYETAKLISENPGATNVGTDSSGKKTAILASGQNFADALTAGPLGYAKKFPVEITDPANLSAATLQAFKDLGITNVLIAGGTAAVSDNVVAQLTANGITSTRLAGATRQLTAVAIANYERANAGFTNTHVNLANGLNYPDALAGGPHAGKELAPILLTDSPDALGAAATQYLSDNSSTLTSGNIFGGTAAVSTAAETAGNTAGKGSQKSATTRPELQSAAITTTTTNNNGTSADPTDDFTALTVRYTFDETVLSPTAGSFHVYPSNTTGTADADSGTAVGANNRQDGDSATVSGNTVDVEFDFLGTSASTANSNFIKSLTLATNEGDAVVDTTGSGSTEGDAAIGTAQTSTQGAAGITTAPDLLSVGNFRQSQTTAATTLVDYTFDEAATATGANGSKFHLVKQDGTVLNGVLVTAGSGTTVLTVSFTDTSAGSAGAIGTANVARGYDDAGAVTDLDGSAVPNPQQAADVGNSGNTTTADLVSATFQPTATAANGTTAIDQVLYTFDQAVTAATPADFQVYLTNATTVTGATNAPFTGRAQINNGNPTQVLVDFPDGTLTNAVGASVLPGAVTDANNNASLADEVGVANQSSSSTTPGRTDGPDLTGVAITQGTDAFSQPNGVFTATYTFDDVVTAATDGNYFLYLSNGTKLAGATCTIGTATTSAPNANKTVACTGFTPTSSAGADQAGAATLGTVTYDAATDGTNASPEGAEFTTGGSGTPTQ